MSAAAGSNAQLRGSAAPSLQERIAASVAAAPPLTEEQAHVIRTQFAPRLSRALKAQARPKALQATGATLPRAARPEVVMVELQSPAVQEPDGWADEGGSP